MSDRLILAVPSKGRLQEQAAEYFADAGLAMRKAAGLIFAGTISLLASSAAWSQTPPAKASSSCANALRGQPRPPLTSGDRCPG